MAKPEASPVVIAPGIEIKDTWKLTKKLGVGSFGEIYLAETIKGNPKSEVAIKFERLDAPKPVLNIEAYGLLQMQGILCLKELSNPFIFVFTFQSMLFTSGNAHFAKSYYFGYFKPYSYLVQEALGPSLLFVLLYHKRLISFISFLIGIFYLEFLLKDFLFQLLYKLEFKGWLQYKHFMKQALFIGT